LEAPSIRKETTVRRLLKLAVVAAAITGVVKLISSQKAEWQGLTESQVRTKLHDKLDSRMPSDKVDEMADKVVEGMRRSGALAEEEAAAPAEG
jgi:hypothetical protein